MNGTFIHTPAAPPAGDGPDGPAIYPMPRLESLPPLPADEPAAVLLARSLSRRVARYAGLSELQRAQVLRDHGLALGSLCGLSARDMAGQHGLAPSTVKKIVARVCLEAGIARGPESDG